MEFVNTYVMNSSNKKIKYDFNFRQFVEYQGCQTSSMGAHRTRSEENMCLALGHDDAMEAAMMGDASGGTGMSMTMFE